MCWRSCQNSAHQDVTLDPHHKASLAGCWVGGWVLWNGFGVRSSFACWSQGPRVISEQQKKKHYDTVYNEMASLDPCPLAWVSQQSE